MRNTSYNGVALPVLKLLLLPGIPPGNFLEIAGHPAYLDNIMGTTVGAYRLPAEGTVLDSRYDLMGAVAVVKGAHDDEMLIAALWAGLFIDDKMTGVALVTPLGNGDVSKLLVLFSQFLLFLAPLHTVK